MGNIEKIKTTGGRLLQTINDIIPVPTWVLLILFGPLLPIGILLIYCINWYIQMTTLVMKGVQQLNTKLIVILGSTATGKSKLGIELAKLFNGEIISADSMQVYRGLDIITNKVTEEECAEIKHHMIDIASPKGEFTVVDFKEKALGVIKKLSLEGKLPVIVGGTNYFIEALLWDFLIEEEVENFHEEHQNRKNLVKICEENEGEIEDKSLYDQLMKVDPERASQLHPNDSRKIARSIQIFHSTGKTHSAWITEQQSKNGSSGLSGPLRFPNCLVFWLTAQQDVLNERISTRVDGMVEKGLLQEIQTFYNDHIKDKSNGCLNSQCLYLNSGCINTAISNLELGSTQTTKNYGNDDGQISVDNDICNNQMIEEHDISTSDSPQSGDEWIYDSVNTTNWNTVEKFERIVSKADDVLKQCDKKFKNKALRNELYYNNLQPGVEITPKIANKRSPENGLCKSYEEGLFQAIGFKEFHSYLVCSDPNEIKKQELLSLSLDRLKQRTVKYSKKQRRWVENRFLARPAQNSVPVYNLDATDLTKYNINVLQRAKEITEAFLNGKSMPYDPIQPQKTASTKEKHEKFVCEVCDNRIIIGEQAWKVHQESRRHKKWKSSKSRAKESSKS